MSNALLHKLARNVQHPNGIRDTVSGMTLVASGNSSKWDKLYISNYSDDKLLTLARDGQFWLPSLTLHYNAHWMGFQHYHSRNWLHLLHMRMEWRAHGQSATKKRTSSIIILDCHKNSILVFNVQ
ncbi:hypothetical protein DPMN_183611 [Dreissena polymorpha]|uniref:Uncharacterized protein n=1 Tax=Dreissena polymorpha TaxID=45954 RepID=A0A9D4DIP8_DREPO|nr:hypothetical protein DPMN_183611 [Dreissena polymorpha]